MENINTIEYWDNRFNTDWESMLGEEQTRFFANVAMDLMPNWLKDEIQNEKLTICDFGCAMGQAVDYLHNTLQTEVSGIDFSESAIAKAKKIYPQYSFTKSDIVNDYNNQFKFDVGYISNVLEHITDPWVAAQNISQYLKKYFIILIPFRETIDIEEHCNKFDLNNIPVNIDNFRLIYVAHKDCAEIEETLYADKQIMLVYCASDEKCAAIRLDSLVQNFESILEDKTEILNDKILELSYNMQKKDDNNRELGLLCDKYKNEIDSLAIKLSEKQNEFNHANERISELNNREKELRESHRKEIEELQFLQKKAEEQNEELQRVLKENERKIQKKDKKITDLKDIVNEQTQKIDYSERQEEYMRNMIYNLQVKDARIKNTISWKITKPLRDAGALAKEVKSMCKERKIFWAKIRNSAIYNKFFKSLVPQKIKDYLMDKYFVTSEDMVLFQNNDQERCVLEELARFEENIRDEDQILLVFSGVKYIDSEGQRNIRLIHEAIKLGKKIIFAYWRWGNSEKLEPSEENMVKIPIDILTGKKVYIFETFFRNVKDKCLLVEFPHPYVTQIIEIANSFGWKTVYDVIDDWEEFSKCGQAGWYRREVERRVANIVDVNVATAYVLRDKIKNDIIIEKPYYVITNGVDPNRMKKSEKLPEYNYSKGSLQIGYFGHLTDAWFDWTMLKALAQKHGDWTFHIIGYGAPEKLEVPDNIILYGKKMPEELPKYAAYWDVAIIPFINNELTKGVNPIKVFEYLQLRLPVVASNMPEIAGYPYVSIAVGCDEFEKSIQKASKIVMDDDKVQAFIESNTWKNKCIELLDCIEKIEK